ncbi:unnamed protein product [Phytophthora lilii]|uniref:Unnamed protein product n=1 Tax=Phytophthora lilii TaxID=2077276 RepID=A0A9W7CPG1_9STRA|nr:unnamed protein product [Phytophthora lilii]
MSNINASVWIFPCPLRSLGVTTDDAKVTSKTRTSRRRLEPSPNTRLTAAPAVGTAPSSSEAVGTASSPAAAGVESSSPDGSSKLSSGAVAVEAHVAQACSGSHGVSSLASAESSSSAQSNSVVTREVLEELLMRGAESLERVIDVLGPRLEQLGRLAVGLQVVPVSFSRESVGRQIQVDPALTVSEISAGWDSDFRGPASPDLAQDASSATPWLATSNDTLVAPSTEDPDHLLFLAQVSAAELTGEDGGGASEGS